MKCDTKIVHALDAISCSATAHAMAVPATFNYFVRNSAAREV